jgi:hypothetical protein
MKARIRTVVLLTLSSALIGLSGCALPRAVGKTAGGVVKGAGKVVSGTAKAVTKPLR